MIIDAWCVMSQKSVDHLVNQAQSDNVPGSVMGTAVRGFWNNIAPDEVINIIGSFPAFKTFVIQQQINIKSLDTWIQGTGLDEQNNWPTNPNRVLSFMPDISPGNPANFDNANWRHEFLGQKERVFAGEFSTEFSEEFF